MSDRVPLEEVEQANFVRWLEERGLKFTAIPNNTYTKFQSQKNKNTRTGLRAGFPDLVVLIPPERSKTGVGYFLCIEMKRIRDSYPTAGQKAWIAAINGLESEQVEAHVAKGAEDAIWIISRYMIAETPNGSPF